ncbi:MULTISPECIES: fibrinogen-binding protein [Agrobacterium]|uniref:Fibrinogen-binding protein n=1 Tax=Agrobacterium rosae TaxID=1972867 RepID=A0A1R3TC12_9HYPH|nr:MULTISPECIES: fibrinogen-binding protein [Agrobacterium]KAA3515488.1 fibrinogen-binding protein [Agrobacterium rosae]KAA3524454.1 fibrinogen-binding protein [Agrobacterium rosae]MBN7804245.1 fibrinogen-binding protein [Agrobacterium rosae]MCM2431362.1 fibrinogen-binding protein [Agrobacterium rosae]MDX8302329.1 fibrinogen-binding protein [Agrobacterium rosae]
MGYPQQQPAGDDITKVGALADGFANTATNDSNVDDSNVGVANGGNRDNTYTDNSQNLDVDAKVQVATDNGDNRDNSYNWDYDSKTSSYSDNDTNSNNKTVNVNDADTSVKSDYDWSYDSKSYSDNDTKVITNTHTDTDTKTFNYSDTDTDIKTTTDSFNSAFSKTDTDFSTIEHVKDIGNLGVAGGDIAFNLGDDFSFSLNVDNILNNSLNGDGNDSAFSLVQASHLADQDTAYNVSMNNQDAHNDLSTQGGEAHGAQGMDMDGKGWDLKAGDDATGTSSTNASSILANSGYHLELVQGANLLTNSFEGSVIGGDSHHAGEDASS